MAYLSYETFLKELLENSLPEASPGQEEAVTAFLAPFALNDRLKLRFLADYKDWHYPYLRNVGYTFPEKNVNYELGRQYNIQVFSVPDKLHALLSWKGHVVPVHWLPVYCYPEVRCRKMELHLAGADSCSIVEAGILLSGQVFQRPDEQPQIYWVRGGATEKLEFSGETCAFLQGLQVANIYGFAQQGAKIFFGTWGRPSNARLMQGEIRGNTLCNLVDITPVAIRAQGYDDLFVKDGGDGWLKIGGKLGKETIKPAIYYLHSVTRDLKTIPLDITGTPEKSLLDHNPALHNHLYFHQHYPLENNLHGVLIAGRLGALLHIVAEDGSVRAKYHLGLPNDSAPIAEYPWLHTFKHASSKYMYIADNDGIIHRFHYDVQKETLYVLKFKVPFGGEVSAIAATSFGFYLALRSNRCNLVLKVTHDLQCFLVYEAHAAEAPITSLCELPDNEVLGLTGSRFFPYYLFSPACHYINGKTDHSSCKMLFIKANSHEDDNRLAEADEPKRLKRLIEEKIRRWPQYEFFLYLAAMEFKEGNWGQAIEYAKEGIKRETTALYPYKILGLACMHEELFEEAAEALRYFLAQMPADDECKDALNFCLGRSKGAGAPSPS